MSTQSLLYLDSDVISAAALILTIAQQLPTYWYKNWFIKIFILSPVDCGTRSLKMVLKKPRFGKRSTGNTQRCWLKDVLPGDSSLVMIKEVSNSQLLSKSGKGVMNPFDGNLGTKVFYSLKKKKRWTLLETLYQNQLDSSINFKVNLDASKTSSDVVIKVKLQDEIETREKKSKKISHASLDENDKKEIVPEREINYRIIYPIPRRDDYYNKNGRCLWWRMETKNLRWLSEEEKVIDIERWEDNEELEQISSQQNTYSENNFFDYLMKARVINGKKRSKLRLPSKKRSSSITILPDHVIYEKGEEVSEIVISEPPAKVNEVLMIPKLVAIWAEDLKEDYLKQNFEKDYHELDCIPRTFLIRISSFLKNALDRKMSKDLNLENLFLVFNISQIKITNENKRSVRVYLHGNFNAESLGIETLHSHETYSIQSIIIKTVDYLTKIMFTSLLAKDPSTAYSRHSAHDYVQAITNDYLDIDINVYSTQEAVMQMQCRIKSVKTSELDSLIAETFEIAPFCNICYDEVIHCDGFVNGMALLPCHHWICNSCWHNYIINQFLLTKSQIICPAHDCKVSLPIDTIRAIVGGEDFNRYMLRNSLVVLNLQAKINWCPNPQCGHMAVISRNDFKIYDIPINCVCQHNWCFGCQNESHWPASCQQVVQYESSPVITNWREKEGAIVEVFVKNCPTCKYAIEKSYGCPYMICKCGSTFCWDCLQTLDKHKDGCKKEQFKLLQRVELIDVVRNKHSTLYNDLCDFHKLAHRSLTKLQHKLKKKMQYIKVPHSHGISHNTDELVANCQQVIHDKLKFREEVQMGILTLIKVHKFCEFTTVWLHFSKFHNLREKYIATNLLCQLYFLLTRVNQHLESKNFVEIPKYIKQIKKAVKQLSVQVILRKIEEKKRQQQNETKLS